MRVVRVVLYVLSPHPTQTLSLWCLPPPLPSRLLQPLSTRFSSPTGLCSPNLASTSISRRLLPPVMASLSFIMDVNDDSQTDGRPPLHKRDRGPNKPASAGPLHGPPPSNPQPDPDHASSPGLAIPEQDIKRAVPAGQTKRRGASLRGPKSSSTAPTSGTEPSTGTGVAAVVSSSSSSSPSLSASTARQSISRRRSTASTESMDRSRYGSVPSSSSVGGGLQRPIPHYPAAIQYAPKITPKTGRVSKAKKGLPVHICDICRPPKVRTSSFLPPLACSLRTSTDSRRYRPSLEPSISGNDLRYPLPHKCPQTLIFPGDISWATAHRSFSALAVTGRSIEPTY